LYSAYIYIYIHIYTHQASCKLITSAIFFPAWRECRNGGGGGGRGGEEEEEEVTCYSSPSYAALYTTPTGISVAQDDICPAVAHISICVAYLAFKFSKQ